MNGPSIARIARTLLRGFLALGRHPDPRVRDRVLFETKDLATAVLGGSVGVRALVPRLARRSPPGCARSGGASSATFGWKAWLAARVVGPVVLFTLWREERRLRRGVTYEPETFYDANPAAAARPEVAARDAAACRWVEPQPILAERGEAVA